jgi:hypothetical protein
MFEVQKKSGNIDRSQPFAVCRDRLAPPARVPPPQGNNTLSYPYLRWQPLIHACV